MKSELTNEYSFDELMKLKQYTIAKISSFRIIAYWFMRKNNTKKKTVYNMYKSCVY